MAASVEYQVVSKLIETGDLTALTKAKITEDFFHASECREIFRFVRDHYHKQNTYGSVPSRDLLKKKFPGFAFVKTNDTLATLCEFLRDTRLTSNLQQVMEEIDAMALSDPHQALDLLRTHALSMSSAYEQDNDHAIASAHDALLAEYEQVSKGMGTTGIPFPWDVLNKETQGMNPEDYIVIYGRPKSMKSWVAFVIAAHAYFECKQRVLVSSLELAPRLCLRRIAALLSKVSYSRVKRGKLTSQEYERFFTTLKCLKQMERKSEDRRQGLLVSGRGGRNAGGVSSLHAKIKEYDPDLVIVDGVYLMKDDRQSARNVDWKSMSHISQDLKDTAATCKIPLIAVTQANKTGSKTKPQDATVDEVAYSDSFGQDADLVMKVTKRRDEMKNEPELFISFPASRESELNAFVIEGKPAVSFGFKRAVLAQDEEDEEESEAPKKKKGSKKDKEGEAKSKKWRRFTSGKTPATDFKKPAKDSLATVTRIY